MDQLDAWMKRDLEVKLERQKSSEKTSQNHPEKRPPENGGRSNVPPRGGQKTYGPKHRPARGPVQKAGQGQGQQQQRTQQGQQPQRPAQGQQRPPQRQGQRPPQGQSQRQPQRQPQRPVPRATQRPPQKPTPKNHPLLRGKLKIIPLGGLDEVGKNMMVFEYEEDIIIVDMGFEFPGEDMLGIDYVIPDVTYLEENAHRIRGVVLTHGHLDHIGGIPYILPKINFPPLFGTKLTMGLVKKRVEEFNQEKIAKLFVIDPDKPLKLGKFTINFFRVVHSIPDAAGVVIDTPAGKIVHTGDFKFDETPASEHQIADMDKIRDLKNQNVLALFSDSTNALKPGKTMSEKQVGAALEEVVKNTESRIIIASFSSLIGRIQQIIDIAEKCNRKIFVSGRSMRENMEIAAQLGYLKFKKGQIQDIRKYKDAPDHETLILTTGSQGEAVSALTRISNNNHPHIKIKKGDTVILSASPIIGNERAIFTVINSLCIMGAKVISNQIMDVHTSGHGFQEDLKQMIEFVKPKYFIPIHGEYFMRQAHAQLAHEQCGLPEDHIIMLQNGDVLLGGNGAVAKSSDKIETKYILIDGRGEGQVGSNVQFDREIMSENGALVVLIYISYKSKKIKRDPDVISRGFIYMHETEEITAEIIRIAKEAYRKIVDKNPGANRQDIKKYIKQTIDKYTHQKLERRPLIVPLIVEM